MQVTFGTTGTVTTISPLVGEGSLLSPLGFDSATFSYFDDGVLSSNTHIADMGNPHGVTPSQIGATTPLDVVGLVDGRLAGAVSMGSLSFSWEATDGTSNMRFRSSLLASGTGTTCLPQSLHQAQTTPNATNWNVNGTYSGMNAPSGFMGNFFDMKVAGVNAVQLSPNGVAMAQNCVVKHLSGTGALFGHYHGLTLSNEVGLGVKWGSGSGSGGLFDAAFMRLSPGLLQLTNGSQYNSTTGIGNLRDLRLRDARMKPSSSISPVDNGDLVIEATSNTLLTFRLRGSDGIVRSAMLTLV